MGKNIETIEYHCEFPLMEPLHATRHFKKVKNGKNILEKDRIYVLHNPASVLVRMIPLKFQMYNDEDWYFFNKEELKEWKNWDEYREYIEMASTKNKMYRIKKKELEQK